MSKIVVKKSPVHGKGVFAKTDISIDDTIEYCDVLVLNNRDRRLIDRTNIYNYYFEWDKNGAAICLGSGSLYNHSYDANANYISDIANDKMIFVAVKNIHAGEEITVNYNGVPDSKDKVWFDK